jgi:hypothetical protein
VSHMLQTRIDSAEKNKSACVQDMELIQKINDVLSSGVPVVIESGDNNTSPSSHLAEKSENTQEITFLSFEPNQGSFIKSNSPQGKGEHSAKVRNPCKHLS